MVSRINVLLAGLLCIGFFTQAAPLVTQQAVRNLLDDDTSFETVSDDTLSILTGYHVIYSWPGSRVPQELYDLTSAGKVGGVIIFGENVNDKLPEEMLKLQDSYKQSPAYIGKPLLVVTDQEGGEVVRLPGGPRLTEKDIGASSHPVTLAKRAGTVAAEACKAYRVNGNLAPVLDVFRHQGDFDDQYERSYSKDSDSASACGAAFIKAQQSQGIIATAKHFPGLGAARANQNTDLAKVTLDVSLEELRSIDEVPFVGSIAAGVNMVMTSWAVYPALDAKRPAGLSSKWIRDELRGRLGFTGVTISDALEAHSLQGYGSNGTRGVLAVEAGIDIALASGRNVSQGTSINEALVAALKDGTIAKSDFIESTKRVLALGRSPFTRLDGNR